MSVFDEGHADIEDETNTPSGEYTEKQPSDEKDENEVDTFQIFAVGEPLDVPQTGPDPDKEDEIKDKLHKALLTFLGVPLYIILILGIFFLIALFFVIMPYSIKVSPDCTYYQGWLREYSRAFISSLGSFGATLLAIAVSEFLKHAHRQIKESKNMQK